MIGAIEEIQTIKDILAGVGMDDVEKNSKTHTVRGVDELFQILRRAITRRRGEEACDLIAERLDKELGILLHTTTPFLILTSVIGMLHGRHELNRIITETFDPPKDVLCEFFVRPYTGLCSRDTNVCLVHFDCFWFRRSRVPPLVAFTGGRVPKARVIDRRHVQILGDTFDPRGNALDSLAAWGEHGNLDFRVVGDNANAVFSWNSDAPYAILVACHLVRLP